MRFAHAHFFPAGMGTTKYLYINLQILAVIKLLAAREDEVQEAVFSPGNSSIPTSELCHRSDDGLAKYVKTNT